MLLTAGGRVATTAPGCSLNALSPAKEIDTTTNSQLAAAIEAVNSTVKSSIENSISNVSNELWPYVVLGIIVVMVLAGVLVLVLVGMFWLLRQWIEKHSYLNQKPEWESRKAGLAEATKKLEDELHPLDRTLGRPEGPGSRAGT